LIKKENELKNARASYHQEKGYFFKLNEDKGERTPRGCSIWNYCGHMGELSHEWLSE
jgi:hypothetical protein